MADNNNNSTSVEQKWYEEPVKKWFAIIAGFIFIAGLGYSFARIQLNIEFRMERYEMKQEFNEHLQNQINSCKEEKQSLQNRRVENIEETIKNLESKLNEVK
ncbi:MAG: hypothetical protein CVU03_02320 [Bacteroidetes bacterium HGW-Bacteroidetes-2]|jgi:flagellar biosynthesis protein FlhB|nr:MAG: hypothetical protein CVU13_05995 [Bacteroidetes bacterium HGW-Bacteroidetes-8]PKP26730.1 MAG: hypothetical protein CVU03_02320 [Bacteroidetes bacterium HGW-Bacteroidetes-2]